MSHETIYNAIYAYPRGELRRQLIVCLHQSHAKRLPRPLGTDRRGQIPDMVNIHVPPLEVNDRLMPGRVRHFFRASYCQEGGATRVAGSRT